MTSKSHNLKTFSRLILTIFAVVVMVAGFWAATAPKAEADCTTDSSCDELFCYKGGTTPNCGSYADDAISTPSGYVKTCTIGGAVIKNEWVSGSALSSCVDGVAKCGALKSSGMEGSACPSGASAGDSCIVRSLDGSGNVMKSINAIWDVSSSSGTYDCIQCGSYTSGAATVSNVALKFCGASNSISGVDSSGLCTVSSDKKFRTICGATTPCNEKSFNDPCTPLVGTAVSACDKNGVCATVVAATLTVTANPTSVVKGTATTINFTVTDGTNAVNDATVSITSAGTTGMGTSGTCTASGSNQCSFSVTATAVGTATATASKTGFTSGTVNISATCLGGCIVGSFQCSGGTQPQNCNLVTGCGVWENASTVSSETGALCSDSKDNDCDGKVDGDDTDCQGNPCMLWMTEPIVKKPKTVTAYYSKVSCNVGYTEIRDPSTSKASGVSTPPGRCNICTTKPTDCGYIQYDITATDVVGTWTAKLVGAVDDVGNSCADKSVSFKVVECKSNSDCASNNCDANGACVSAVAPPPPSISVCDQLSCGGVVTNVPCMCGGVNKITENGKFCCAADGFSGDEKNCKDSYSCLPAIIAPPPPAPVPCGNGIKDTTPPEACDTNLVSSCASGTVCNSTCTACIVPPCSGTNMFESPLSFGYCTIEEILTNATNWILSLVSSIIVLIMIIGGLMYISSAGDEEKLVASKNIIKYAAIGLGIILVSYALITEVANLLKGV